MRKIICLSTSPWYPHPTRKQQVMSRIADAEILYFNPPVTYLAPLKDKSLKAKLHEYRMKPVKPQGNVLVFSLPPVLPFFYRNRFLNRLNQAALGRYIRRKMSKYGFEDAVLWVYSPMYADIVGHIPHNHLVYDCVDRHSAYKGQIDPGLVDKMEEELAGQCSAVFCTAQGLTDRLTPFNKNTFTIPNGADFERFNAIYGQKPPLPDDMRAIKGPVLGFVGVLREWVDTGMLAYVAEQRPDWSVVLVGPEGDADLKALKALPNVHFLGAKPHEALPGYIAAFDICLNAFRSGDLAKDVSPLKFYEYLATGKPVVSTAQPLQVERYRDCVYIAQNEEEFLNCCERALDETDSRMVTWRLAAAREASWEARVREITTYCTRFKIF